MTEDAAARARATTRRRFVLGSAALGASAAAIAGTPGRGANATAAVTSEAAVSVVAAGARGDGSVDDRRALQTAIDGLPPSGGTLVFPPGVFRCDAPLVFDGRHAVALQGAGGLSGGARQASVLQLEGRAGPLLSGRSTAGLVVNDIALAGAQVEGTVIDLSRASGAGDTVGASFNRCHISNTTGAGSLVELEGANSMSFHDCRFEGGEVGVRGRMSRAGYANAIRFDACIFGGSVQVPVQNPGQAWLFLGCTFEPAGAKATVAAAIGMTPGLSASGTTLAGCWFGDAAAEGTWIAWSGSGLSVTGCYFSGGAVSIRALGSGNAGLAISGNQFVMVPTAIDLGVGCSDALVIGNDFGDGVVSGVVALSQSEGSLYQSGAGGLAVGDRLMLAGGATLTNGSGAPENDVTASVGSLYLDRQGGPGSVLFIKEAGDGPTGWRAV